jgi:hypothetical protein
VPPAITEVHVNYASATVDVHPIDFPITTAAVHVYAITRFRV